jgi:hypothetical protein
MWQDLASFFGCFLLLVRTYETDSGVEVYLKDESVDVASVAPGVVDTVVEAAQPSYAGRDNLQNFVVTSGHDGEHSPGSLHDDGLAVDLRVWGFTDAEAKRTTAEIQQRLGGRWDVVYEGTHIHVEYDPS